MGLDPLFGRQIVFYCVLWVANYQMLRTTDLVFADLLVNMRSVDLRFSVYVIKNWPFPETYLYTVILGLFICEFRTYLLNITRETSILIFVGRYRRNTS